MMLLTGRTGWATMSVRREEARQEFVEQELVLARRRAEQPVGVHVQVAGGDVPQRR